LRALKGGESVKKKWRLGRGKRIEMLSNERFQGESERPYLGERKKR